MKRRIPGTDLFVMPVCFGTAGFGDTATEEQANQFLDHYTALGGNFIDTANCYGKWLPNPSNWSEQFIGRWLARRGNRGNIVLSSKGGHPRFSSMTVSRLKEKDIRADWEESAAALQTGYIDFYWLHRDDPSIPAEELVEVLEAMRREGKIRYYGFSNWQAVRVAQAMEYAAQKGYGGPSGLQNRWSLARVNEAEMTDQTLVCMDSAQWELLLRNRESLSAVSYTSMGNGVFSRWVREGEESLSREMKDLYLNGLNRRRAKALEELAGTRQVSVAALVLAWQVSQPFAAVPISAASKTAQIDDAMAACSLRLTRQERELLGAGEQY